MSKKLKGLGKGLSALLPENNFDNINDDVSVVTEGIREVAVTDLLPNPSQPRKNFTSEALTELSLSIKEHGVLQPLVVRQISSGKYEIVAGERRWRASKMAGISKVPVIVKDLKDKDVMQIAIIENIQRQDLNPVEEAEAFQRLITEYSMTQEEMAIKIGKSRPYIANALRLLGLNKIVRTLLAEGKISAGHARAIVTLDPEEQIAVAEKIIQNGLSVRETEKITSANYKKINNQKPQRKIDADIKAFENELRVLLGTKIAIKPSDKGGCIEISYYSNEDLIRIADILFKK